MAKATAKVVRWRKSQPPTEKEIRAALKKSGAEAVGWTDTPGTFYGTHIHEHAEVRWVVRGHMRFGLSETGEEFLLGPGDRIELTARTPHWARAEGDVPVYYLGGSFLKQ